MTTIIVSITIVILSFLSMQWLQLPWFTPVVVAFLLGLFTGKFRYKSFIAGAFGIILFWLLKSIPIYVANSGVVPQKAGALFTEQLGFTISPFLFLIFTLILGGILGGWATFSGHLISNRNNLNTTRKGSTYKLNID